MLSKPLLTSIFSFFNKYLKKKFPRYYRLFISFGRSLYKDRSPISRVLQIPYTWTCTLYVVIFLHVVFVLQVRWPNGIKSNYRFGHTNKYDLFLWLCIYFLGQNLFGKKIILFLFLSFCFVFFSLIQCIKLYVISINNIFFSF